MDHHIYLGLGSNLGDRQENIFKAIRMLEPDVHPRRFSSVYETQPWGVKEQPTFLNCVISAETGLDPRQLLDKLKSIEKTMGRKPTFQYGPRLIDLDILLYDRLIISTAELTIPHPHMLERSFVLVPLAEIAGRMRHPIANQTFTHLARATDKSGVVKYGHIIKDGKHD